MTMTSQNMRKIITMTKMMIITTVMTMTTMMRITTMMIMMTMKTAIMMTKTMITIITGETEVQEEAVPEAVSKETAREDLLPAAEAIPAEILHTVPVPVPAHLHQEEEDHLHPAADREIVQERAKILRGTEDPPEIPVLEEVIQVQVVVPIQVQEEAVQDPQIQTPTQEATVIQIAVLTQAAPPKEVLLR